MSLLEENLRATQVIKRKAIDQRRDPRYLCIDRGVLRLAVRPEFRGRRALMMDVSSGGIGFLLEDALDAGSILVFELKDGAGTIARVAHVRHCRPHPVCADAPWLKPTQSLSGIFRRFFGKETPAPPIGQAWLVGCEFDKPLTDDELKEFLEQLKSLRIDR